MLNTKIIGQRMADARKKMNISQAQLAEQLFISAQAVGKWERGESMPDILTLNHLAEILGVDLNYFSAGFQAADMASSGQSSNQTPTDVLPLPTGNKEDKLNWDMSGGNWVDADFSGLGNLQEKFSSSNMQRCLFIGSDLSGLVLKRNNIERCDFSGSDISNSRVQGSSVVSNSFRDCSWKATEFSGSHVKSCDFSGADFSGAVLRSCDFHQNTIAGATWNRTSFQTMQLTDLVFDGALEDCAFENCSFSKVTFENATLTNVFFKGTNLKRTRFIDCKADKLTYAFLKNGKADLSGVTLLTT